ncbi:MAG: DeoR/GlpR family DNA-binding transcription regulator [Oscillospiraceae bacterium]|jgi:DeoR family myo-inositol catabolism operon transcriptional repressor|nr:DeoR/GlpR family DNA-binding transcription regulator [Oscillospiraceae bacterium]
MKINRLDQIEQYITANQTVSLDKLCEVFGISKNTVRRDINDLVKKGNVRKVYGGVTAEKRSLVPFEERNIKSRKEKQIICQKAAESVNDGDVIYIDSGTTTANLVDFLKGKNITILTQSLNVVLNALPYSELKIFLLGGNLIRDTNSFSILNMNILERYNINKAFMAAAGLSIENGVTNSSPLEYEIKKSIVKKSDKSYLLADHSKFGNSSLMTFCRLEDISCIVTDREPPKKFLSFFEKHSIELKIANAAVQTV